MNLNSKVLKNFNFSIETLTFKEKKCELNLNVYGNDVFLLKTFHSKKNMNLTWESL